MLRPSPPSVGAKNTTIFSSSSNATYIVISSCIFFQIPMRISVQKNHIDSLLRFDEKVCLYTLWYLLILVRIVTDSYCKISSEDCPFTITNMKCRSLVSSSLDNCCTDLLIILKYFQPNRKIENWKFFSWDFCMNSIILDKS